MVDLAALAREQGAGQKRVDRVVLDQQHALARRHGGGDHTTEKPAATVGVLLLHGVGGLRDWDAYGWSVVDLSRYRIGVAIFESP